MILLYITNGITGVGGLERVLSIKASYLGEKLDYSVHIISLNESAKEPFYSFSPLISLHPIGVGRNPFAYIGQIRRIVKQIKPDIISVCDDGLKGFFVPLWLKSPHKIIYERHASVTLNVSQGGIKHWLMRQCAKMFDRFVVLTNYNVSEWGNKNVVVIPNPLPFFPSHKSMLGSKTVLSVGKITYQKGYERLVDIWRDVYRICPDWEAHIYGQHIEPFHSNLMKTIESEGLGNVIFVYQPEKNIMEKYLEASIYALPSYSEGFGMVLIEAMACGVPCVAFDCPCGPRDIISDGEDGFLVENGNIEQFASRLVQLMKDENLRKQMGYKARENAQKYSIENVALEWHKLFKGLLK